MDINSPTSVRLFYPAFLSFRPPASKPCPGVLDYPAPRPPALKPWRWRAADTSKSQLPLSTSHRPIKHTLNPLRQLNRLLRLTLFSKDPIPLFHQQNSCLLCLLLSFWFLASFNLPIPSCFWLLLFYHSVHPLFSRDVDCPPLSPSDWPFRKGVPSDSL